MDKRSKGYNAEECDHCFGRQQIRSRSLEVLFSHRNQLRLVKTEEGENVGKENGLIFLEVSARTGDNIVKIFEKIGYQMLAEEGNTEQPKASDGNNIVLMCRARRDTFGETGF